MASKIYGSAGLQIQLAQETKLIYNPEVELSGDAGSVQRAL